MQDRKLLLSELAERAKQRGIKSFTGTVLGENRRALDFFLALSSEVRARSRTALTCSARRYLAFSNPRVASLEGVGERRSQPGQ